MDESEDNMSAEDIKSESGQPGKTKPKKRSLVERELETSLTSRVTSPITTAEASSTSRYGRARRLKTETEFLNFEKMVIKIEKSPTMEKTPVKVQSPVYKMHASNSPMRSESPKGTPNKVIKIEPDLENQIENIYHENISLSRFGSEEKTHTPNKIPKVYVRKDLIQKREEEDSITLIKNLFSPAKSGKKSNSHINNILERSSEKYGLSASKSQNGYASVVKTLDFDSKKRKKDNGNTKMLSKSELFDMEAKCEYQVGDLAWSRMGTYPFWPCIVTREPSSGMFVKKKLFGRIERDVIHVTFFGDNGRRGWIVDTMLRKFHGQLEFEATREQFTPADKKKDPRLYAAFFVSEKKQPQWNISVEEAELLLREPKRLRIDILNDMLMNPRVLKTTPRQNKSGKITRTASDVSLSESLYDTLFSEDDGKEDPDRSRNKSKSKSLDVSDVVTACLDNMAAKTGITKIQRQSHMDRWLQKAKSKTPEKSQARAQLVSQKVDKKETKVSSAKKKKRSPIPNPRPLTQKPYSFRRSANESQEPHLNDYSNNLEFAPSLNSTLNNIEDDSDGVMNIEQLQSGIGVIAKVESLSDSANESLMDEEVKEHLNHKIITEDSENKSETENIQIINTNESTIDTDTSVKDNQGIDSIKTKSLTESESYSVSTSIESDNVPVDTKIKLDNNGMDTSAIEDSKEKNETAVKEKLIIIHEELKSLIEECNEVNTVATECTKAFDNYDMDISSIEEKNESSEIASQNSFIASITETESIDNISPKSPNNLVNGDISDHNMSSKYSGLKSESTKNSSSCSQELNINDSFKPLSTEVIKTPYTDPEFLKYLEMRQDSLMDQHPDLSHDEIVEYLHKTWLYEEKPSGDTEKTDVLKQSNNVLNKSKSKAKSKKKQTRKTRQRKINESIDSIEYQNHTKQIDECKEKPIKLINSYNDIRNDIDASDDMNTPKSIANNDVRKPIELEITNEIILNLNKTVPTERSDEVENMSVNKSPEANRSIEGNSSVPTLESEGRFQEDIDLSNPEKKCLELKNTFETETYDPKRVTTFGDTQKTLSNISINESVFEKTSESNKDLEETSSSIPCDNTKTCEVLNISYTENQLHEQEVKETIPKANASGTDCPFISNCKPITVGVSEETEVEIIANKKQEINDKDVDILISAVDLDDELSDDSLDISYAISPLSVKGDEPNEDLIKIEADDIHGNQNNEVSDKPMVNGVCDSDPENIDIEKDANSIDILNSDLLNEAGPKATIVSNETKHDLEVKEEEINTDNTVPNKEIVDNIKVTDVAKMNGTHASKFMADLEGDNSSIHSEDSEPLSVTKNKLKLKRKERTNKYADPEFVKYLEMRQDDVMDEHPELNQDEIVEYLYKTWLYEENTKSEIRKTDDVQQSSIVKGLGEPKPETKKRKPRENKEKKKEKDTVIGKDSDVETASVKSEESTTLKRWLRPKRYTSKLYVDFDSSRDSSPAITDEISETISLNSLDSDDSRANKYSPRSKASRPTRVKSDKLILNDDIKVEKELLDVPNDIDLLKTSDTLPKMVNGFKDTDAIVDIKEEFDPETASLNSEGSEVSLSKRKQKSKGDKKMDDPEFLKYLELRQDALIDENPQLTQDEIVSYLYKTWLYEESVKSDMKKSDEIEQSNLVKGINQDIGLPKKVIRNKIKLEKDVDAETIKFKPKRKTIQPYYNEDYLDIEDEIAIFEIMKNSPKVELSKMDLTDLKIKETESKTKVLIEKPKESIDQKQKESEVIEIEDEIDEVELFFEELTQPKPNLFKGLIREKVCEICEKVGNLVKCKGCNGMFHVDCVKHELEVVEKVSVPSKGRKKKKKKPGRKAKNLEDSGSLSDEKSQDVSAENMSIDEIIEPLSHTVDAVNFEAQLEKKMKELLESNDKEIHYDSYSSDDGLDWEGTIAGKCEIVDVKLKPKSQNDDFSDFKCNNCQKYELPICFVCKSAVSKTGVEYRQRCQVAHCHKFYHLECLDHWPQTQFNSGESRNKKTNEKVETHMCPRHVCHTCVSDDPRGCKTRFSGDKLARCVRCPATYHSFTKCLPAGTQILTGSHIICPRHYEHRPGKVPCHVNTGWCFICALGGTLICCEYCPTSFHAECLNISPPEGNYMCEDCETGRLPLYGEMVWVKLGHYRWWPGIVLHPSEIPDNIMAVKHSPGEFVVRFFGQYDHYWVNRGRVFPFQEGDSGKISSQKSKIDAAFTTAMEHAQRACQILKNAQENEEESLDIASSLLPPHYVKLKVNKPVGTLINKRVDIEESSLTQCDCDPSVPDPCGPYSQCLNRMLLTECGPICRAGDRCNNRAFEKRQYPKLVPYRTSHRGWGLKTLEDIKAGQFVIEYVGELIDEEEFKRRMARKHEIRDENFYFLTLDKERMIDAGPKGNLARFMNHCCEPNCETQKWTVLGDVRVGLFAIHDIPANSEVTFNYNLECAGIDKKRCMCGAKRCAGYIGAKPKQDESQSKKSKLAAKRTYKKRKNTEESPSTKSKPKRPVGRPAKHKELTEIEKDLLIIKNATNGISSDSECSRLSSVEGDRHSKALKRKRVSFSTEESAVCNGSPSVKKIKLDEDKVD